MFHSCKDIWTVNTVYGLGPGAREKYKLQDFFSPILSVCVCVCVCVYTMWAESRTAVTKGTSTLYENVTKGGPGQ